MTNDNRLATAVARTRLRLATDKHLVTSVRQGNVVAFEMLYERHSRGLLSFSTYMLGTRDDAEDAVQATFAAAYRALSSSDSRPIAVRPWLFTIARNQCVDILRKRRPTAELNGEPATTGDPARHVELREEVQSLVSAVQGLPERQRASLILAELDGLSQAEIGEVLGVRAEQVKAYVYQARTNLMSEREAREADCNEIREELGDARGTVMLRGRIRRHVHSCADCRAYADGVKHQRRQLAALIPVTPALALKYRLLGEVVGLGAAPPDSAAGAVVGPTLGAAIAELAGGSVKAITAKLAAGVLALGATAEVGASVLEANGPSPSAAETAQTLPAPESTSVATEPVRLAQVRGGRARSTQSARSRTLNVTSSSGSNTPTAPVPKSARPHRAPSGDEHGISTPADEGSGSSGKPSAAGASPHVASGVSESGEARKAEAQVDREEREAKQAQHAHEREERKASKHRQPAPESTTPTEEPPEVGFSESPKKTPQERQELREERKIRHEEGERKRKEREERQQGGGE